MIKNKLNLEGKVRINTQKNDSYIKYDQNSIIKSIVFILTSHLSNIPIILPIFIDISTASTFEKEFKPLGNFTIDDQLLEIHISTHNIKKSKIYKNKLKSLFYNLLHEIYHYIYFLKEYNKEENLGKNPEELFQEINKENILIEKSLKKDEEEYILYHNNLEEEFKADEFALKNLSFFENIYYNDHIL